MHPLEAQLYVQSKFKEVFIDNVGYLYMIKKGKQQHIITKVVFTLVLPHHVHTLSTLKRTLDTMFKNEGMYDEGIKVQRTHSFPFN